MSAAMHAHLRSKLLAADSWLSFDEFMAEALYAPGLGYYSSGRPTFGLGPESGSDFVTAPEMSPFFGRCLARQVSQALNATRCQTVWEFGAGSGALAEQLLQSLETMEQLPARYVIVELSASLRQRQQDRLARYGSRVQWLDRLPERFDGVLVGNEVLDAMPVKLLHFDGQSWLERGVGLDPEGGFCWSDRATSLRPPYDHAQWVPGTVTEIHPHAKAWVNTVATSLQRGALFLIDYGFNDAEYYHPQRLGGTLMCHHLHQSDSDPLVQVGDKDITAHVNFTAVALAGQDAGMEVLGYTSQAHFLLNCGLADLLTPASAAERGMAQKLITEHEMGELFKVIGFATSGSGFDALGFSNGDRSHRL